MFPGLIKAGDNITFDASSSIDRDGYISNYYWDFGDGSHFEGPILSRVNHIFESSGNFTVTLEVTDDNGAKGKIFSQLIVSGPQGLPIITSFSNQPPEILLGNTSILKWHTSNAVSVTLMPAIGKVELNGTVAVSPANNTVYRLIATNKNGSREKYIQVYVHPLQAITSTEPPVALASYYPKEPKVGGLITFDASQSGSKTGNITSYLWSLGDGKSISSNTSVLKHQYSKGGNYNVNLTVTDDKGLENHTSILIMISDPPIPVIELSPLTLTVGDNISFNASKSFDPDGIIVDYSWNFGDGYSSKGILSNHRYQNNGNYNITLEVIDNRGSINQTSIRIKISEPLTPLIKFSPLSPLVGEMVTFNASQSLDPNGTIINYAWSFGDGHNSKGISVNRQYQRGGFYNVTLEVTDNRGMKNQTQAELKIPDTVNAVVFSLDGKRIATASGNRAIIWDVQTGKALLYMNHTSAINDVAFSSRGDKLATASDDGLAKIWIATTGQGRMAEELLNLTHLNRVNAITFSSDDKWIATASDDKTARIWNFTAVSYLEYKVPVVSAPKYFLASRSTANSESANQYYGSEDGGWDGSNQPNDESSVWDREDDEILKRYCRGIISFKPRIPMVVNITNEVKACIAKNNTSGFIALINDQELDKELQIKGIKITRNMTLRLDDPANIFKIERETLAEQRILKDEPTCWRWKVTPLKNGTYELVLVAIADLTKNGAPIAPREEEVLREKIIVIANENETAKQNPIINAKKIANEIYLGIAALITLLGSLFYVLNEYRKLKKGDSK